MTFWYKSARDKRYNLSQNLPAAKEFEFLKWLQQPLYQSFCSFRDVPHSKLDVTLIETFFPYDKPNVTHSLQCSFFAGHKIWIVPVEYYCQTGFLPNDDFLEMFFNR